SRGTTMKSRVLLGGALAALLGWGRAAAALSITLDPIAPISTGQTQTFRVSKVADATGSVTFHWDFGDGTLVDSTEPETTHLYKDAGHYTVFVTATDAAMNDALATSLLTAHYPLTAAPPHNSTSIVVDGERHQVWNVNPDSNTVSVIDADGLR